MLVLSRKLDEAIVINENIEIQVTKIEGDTIKLGIKAPREISILRKEILDSIKLNNQKAASRSELPVPPDLLTVSKK